MLAVMLKAEAPKYVGVLNWTLSRICLYLKCVGVCVRSVSFCLFQLFFGCVYLLAPF